MWWFGLAVVLPMLSLRRVTWVWCKPRGPFLFAAASFIVAMLVVSFRPGNPMPSLSGALLSFGDILFLSVFVRLAYWLGKRPHKVADGVLRMMVHVAAVTAAISLLVFYWLPGRVFPASRLENLFVYFGLAPVLTGILFGFAGLAAAILAMGESRPRVRVYLLSVEALLLFAALCSHTRGAVLALIVGFGALVIVRFDRRLLPPLSVVVFVALIYQVVLPQVSRLSSQESVQLSNPTASLVARKDAGRLDLYRRILGRMSPPGDYLVGRGRWANDVVKPPEMAPFDFYLLLLINPLFR